MNNVNEDYERDEALKNALKKYLKYKLKDFQISDLQFMQFADLAIISIHTLMCTSAHFVKTIAPLKNTSDINICDMSED